MKKIILLLSFLTLSFNISVYADEEKCKFYDVLCKTKKFTADTKDYQKKKWSEGNSKLKK
jgi:hypothetical protein